MGSPLVVQGRARRDGASGAKLGNHRRFHFATARHEFAQGVEDRNICHAGRTPVDRKGERVKQMPASPQSELPDSGRQAWNASVDGKPVSTELLSEARQTVLRTRQSSQVVQQTPDSSIQTCTLCPAEAAPKGPVRRTSLTRHSAKANVGGWWDGPARLDTRGRPPARTPASTGNSA